MSSLIVDNTNQLKEIEDPQPQQYPMYLRLLANFISYLFHPVFIPIYIILFLLYIHPGVFAGFSGWKKTIILLQAVAMYGFFPLVTVLLLKALKFINSVYLKTQRDRVIPYIACMIWYFWLWYVWKNMPDSPPHEIVILALAIFLASIAGLMGNIYMKISMHAIAMGVMLAFMILLATTQPGSFGLFISIALAIAGLVCSARFMVSDHSPREIYAGLFAGLVSLVIANVFT